MDAHDFKRRLLGNIDDVMRRVGEASPSALDDLRHSYVLGRLGRRKLAKRLRVVEAFVKSFPATYGDE